jgi:hypothetical protein
MIYKMPVPGGRFEARRIVGARRAIERNLCRVGF